MKPYVLDVPLMVLRVRDFQISTYISPTHDVYMFNVFLNTLMTHISDTPTTHIFINFGYHHHFNIIIFM
jgi:hypothetical protein